MLLFLCVLSVPALTLATEPCRALFVLDASNADSFRIQILSIAQVADAAYNFSDVQFKANFWVYGDAEKETDIPQDFYESSESFISSLRALNAIGGHETVLNISTRINYEAPSAVIVLISGSTQRVINNAGQIYDRQADTVGVSITEGVNMSAISMNTYLQISDLISLTDNVHRACNHYVPIHPGFKCNALFALDGSSDAAESFLSQKSHMLAVAETLYGTKELEFGANVWEYGRGENDDSVPLSMWPDMVSFNEAVNLIGFYDGEERIDSMVDTLNFWYFERTAVVLYSSSNHTIVGWAGDKYRWQHISTGISTKEADMTPVAIYSFSDMRDVDGVAQSIQDICGELTRPPPILTTTDPRPICGVYFMLDGTSNGTASLNQQTRQTLEVAQLFFAEQKFYHRAGAYVYGDSFGGEPNPDVLLTSIEAFYEVVDVLGSDSPDMGNVCNEAIQDIESLPDFGSIVIVLFTASDQKAIACENKYKQNTIGIAVSGQDLSSLASSTFSTSSSAASIASAISQRCPL